MIVRIMAVREGFKLPEDDLCDSRPGITILDYRVCSPMVDGSFKESWPKGMVKQGTFKSESWQLGERVVIWRGDVP